MLQCGPAMRNKVPILEVLQRVVSRMTPADQSSPLHCCASPPLRLLEIASGTGEHAAHVAANIPNILYQPSDPDGDKMDSIRAWNEAHPCVLPPLQCEVSALLSDEALISGILSPDGCGGKVDVIVCINMIHISPFKSAVELMQVCGKYLRPGGVLFLYGPYRVKGQLVESNIEFDKSLKSRNEDWGIRDIEAVESVAAEEGMTLTEMVEMPANNLSIIFEMKPTTATAPKKE